MYQVKLFDILGLILASCVLGAGVAWFIASPGYEPALCLIGGIAGLLPCLKNIYDGRIFSGDKERIQRSLSIFTKDTHYLLQSQNFEAPYNNYLPNELREFYHQKNDPKLILAEKVLEDYRQRTISEVGQFLTVLSTYTFYLSEDFYGINPDLNHKDPDLFKTQLKILHDSADATYKALSGYIAFAKKKFPDLDIR